MEQEVKPQFAQFNSKILAFKYPSSFDEKTCRKIIELFKQQVNQGNLYLSFEDVKKLYENLKDQDEKKRELEFKTYIHTSNWLKKNPDDLDMDKQAESESDRLLRENLKIMLYDDVIKSVVIIYHSDSTLKEIKKHFLVQINRDLLTQAKELSRKAILHFIRDRLQHSEYPYDTVTEEANIFHSLPDHFFDANSILYSLISENNVVKVPLLKEKDGSQVYSDFLIPGRLFETEVNQFMDTELIPSLAKRYKELSPLISTIMKMHKTHIPVEDIIPEKRETVCRYCFIILEARRQSKDFPMEYFNLAQLTLNCWLAMEHDPLMALRAFPSVELDNDFISPFLSRYIQEFSHIAEYLKTI
ncbi:MAG: hypothetical protein OEZ36_11590, partial [Spirochaetota bacterium]|nr:hypothetical protein [Spirochaetota bacterium]